MKKLEYAGLFFLLALLSYRFFIGSDVQLILRIHLTFLSIFYMWFGFFLFNNTGIKGLFDKTRRAGLSYLQISSSIAAGFLFSFSLIAIMFAVNFYPGMHTMVVLALLFNIAMMAAFLLWIHYNKEIGRFAWQFIWRTVVFTSLFLLVRFTPVDTRLNMLYKNHPRFIEAYNNYLMDPDNPEKQNQLKQERSAFR